MSKGLLEKITDRFIGLNMEDATTLEKQVAKLLIEAGRLEEDADRNLLNSKKQTIYIVHYGEDRFLWHHEAKDASKAYTDLCADFDKQSHRRILVRLFHVEVLERLSFAEVNEALKEMDLNKLAEKATQYKWCGTNL